MRSRVEFGEKKLKFSEFENVRNAFPLRALTHELHWIFVRPLVAHRVMVKSTHQVPNLGSCCFRPLDPVEPLFDCDGLEISPGKRPPSRDLRQLVDERPVAKSLIRP